MSVYVEREGKLSLTISNTDRLVKIQIDCVQGTTATASYKVDEISGQIECGKEVVLGKARELKGKLFYFSVNAKNLDGGQINIHHRIFEYAGNEAKYIFPDEYSGEPNFVVNDPNPTYIFTCNL
jgi:hypothetical protein